MAHAISIEVGGPGVIPQKTWKLMVLAAGYVCRGDELSVHHDESHNMHVHDYASLSAMIAHIN